MYSTTAQMQRRTRSRLATCDSRTRTQKSSMENTKTGLAINPYSRVSTLESDDFQLLSQTIFNSRVGQLSSYSQLNCRISKLWNKLPFINLNHSISTIKTTIYTYLQDHFKNNFASDKPCTYHFCCRCSNCYNLGTPSNFSVM